MKTFFITAGVVCSMFLQSDFASAQQAGQHGVFKATATIPVARVEIGATQDKIVTKSLMTNDVINLALGRALGSKVDTKHEVLAADVTFEDHGPGTPLSKLVIYDPTQNGSAGITFVIASMTEIQFATAYTNATTKGLGIAKATVNPTTMGDPFKNALLEGTLSGSATGAGAHIFNKGPNVTPAASALFTGSFKFRFTDKAGTTTDWEGFVLKGLLKLSGKPIGNYVDP